MREEDVEDGHSAPAASCVHGSMQVLKSVLLLLLANLRKEAGAIPEGLWVEGWGSYHGAGSPCFQAPVSCVAKALAPHQSH